VIKDIKLLEFSTPNDFVDLCDMVESHTKKDSSWAERLAKVTNTMTGQVQQFLEHPINARVVLQQLSTSLIKYRLYAVEIKEVYTLPMEKHRFLYAQTCEELFIIWSKYENVGPWLWKVAKIKERSIMYKLRRKHID
jgi:hypothetical protein